MIKKIFNGLFFLFVLGVFCFSLYKVLTIAGVFKNSAWGVDSGDSCCIDFSGNWEECEWCGDKLCDWCQLCPTPTDVPPVPTPTEPEPTPTEPVPTPTEPVPTPTEPVPTPTEPVPTPTDEPGPPPVGGSSGNGGPASPPVCGAQMPEPPILLSVTPVASVNLVWTEAARATHYSIVYGPSSGEYLYGVPNTGRVTSYHIGDLDHNVNYCFAVRAVSDCMPSGLSNEICMGQGQVLGASTLAATGSFDPRQVSVLVFTLSCFSLGLGLRKQRLAHRSA